MKRLSGLLVACSLAALLAATDGVNLVSVVIPTGNVAPEQLAALVSAVMQGAGAD